MRLDSLRLTIGAILLLLLFACGALLRQSGWEQGQDDATIRASDSTYAVAMRTWHTKSIARQKQLQALAVKHAATERADAREAATRSRVVIADPSTLRVQVTPNGPTTLFTVPTIVVDRFASLQADLDTMRQELTQARGVIATDSALLQADTVARAAQAQKIAVLEGEKRPRLGWKGGAILGSIVTLAAAVWLHSHGVPP